MNRQEVRLRDYLCALLFQWRTIIIGAFIVGSVFGLIEFGVSFYENKKNNASVTNEDEFSLSMVEDAAISDLRNNMSKEQWYWVEKTATAFENYEEMCRHMTLSKLMNLDVKNLIKGDIVLTVICSDNEMRLPIIMAYSNLVLSGSFYKYISTEINLDTYYFEELFTVNYADSEKQIENRETVHISFRYDDEEIATKIIDSIQQYFEEEKDNLTRIYGDFTVEVVEKSIIKSYDSNLYQKQKQMKQEQLSLALDIAENIKAFSKEQKVAYFLLTGDVSAEINNVIDKNDEVKKSEKGSWVPSFSFMYFIFGVFAWMFICVLAISLKYISNNKLRKADDVEDLFGIVDLGTLTDDTSAKRFGSRFDKAIERIQEQGQKQLTQEESIDKVKACLTLLLSDRNIEKIGIVSESVSVNNKLLNKLFDETVMNNRCLIFADEITRKAESIRRIAKVQEVIIIEESGSVVYKDIKNELDILKKHNKNVMGMITI